MPKTRRRADREQFWRDTIAAWRESGQTATALCAARGVAEATFFAERRELTRRDQSPNAPAPGASFPAVGVFADPTVEIVVPGGLVVRVPVGADPTTVARLVRALRGGPRRRNWLHLGGDGGLTPTAMLLSIAASVKRQHLDPWAYLEHVLTTLPARTAGTDLADLLPDVWSRCQPGALAVPISTTSVPLSGRVGG